MPLPCQYRMALLRKIMQAKSSTVLLTGYYYHRQTLQWQCKDCSTAHIRRILPNDSIDYHRLLAGAQPSESNDSDPPFALPGAY